jgi:hypothetical protein
VVWIFGEDTAALAGDAQATGALVVRPAGGPLPDLILASGSPSSRPPGAASIQAGPGT